MRPRDPALLRRRQEEMARSYRDELIDNWRRSVPNEFLGHKTKEISEGRWNNRLSRDGAIDLRRYIESPTKFLLLYGSKGTGKSTLASTLCTRLIADRSIAATYRAAPLLLHSFSWHARDVDPLADAIAAPILFIDDLGAAAEDKSPTQTKALWTVIDARWGDESKLTLLTTNMPINKNQKGIGLIQWLGETAWDRVIDDLTMVELEGDSQRG